jgi:hypothetical protein
VIYLLRLEENLSGSNRTITKEEVRCTKKYRLYTMEIAVVAK